MEFFEWMGIPQTILSYFSFEVENDIGSVIAMQMRIMTICLYVAAGIYLVSLVFGGIGLYKLAKRAGIKYAWMGFVPLLNTFLAGKLAGETSVFGAKIKRVGLYAMLVELVYIGLNVFILVLSMRLAEPAWNELVYAKAYDGQEYISGVRYVIDLMPVGLRWAPTALQVLTIVAQIWYFLMIFALCVLHFAFFRKYFARSPFLMAFICSFFPVRGFVFFAVRNNAPVDYNAWMQERLRRMQQQQQQMYGYPPQYPPQNPQYPPQGPQNPPQGGQEPPKREEAPFGDLGNKDDEPFSDL